jgi:hypothetical protein
MKKHILKSIILVLATVGIYSCNEADFLKPANIPQAPWTDVATFERAAIAPYNYFANVGMANPGWHTAVGVPVFLDLASSDLGTINNKAFVNGPAITFYNRNFRETTVVAGDGGGGRQYSLFKNMYMMINACNDGLAFIKKAGTGEIFPGVLATSTDIKRIKAEFLFNRARAYFILAQQFLPPYNPGGDNSKKLIPFKTEFTSDVDKLRNTTLGSAEDVYNLITSDLKEAKLNMNKTYSVEGRANIYAIRAELVRVDFLIGKYLDAKLECDSILNPGKYLLQDTVLNAFNKAPGAVPASEVIMEFVPDPTTKINDLEVSIVSRAFPWGVNGARGTDISFCNWTGFYMSNYFCKETGWMTDPANGDFTPGPNAATDKRLKDLYMRLEAYRPKNSGESVTTWKNTVNVTFRYDHPVIWLDKYFRGAVGDNTKEPLYRSAEFHLTRAALLTKLNLPDGNGYDLNKVRVRAGLPKLTRTNFTNEAWLVEIERERMREMGPESGDRVRYLMSMRQPIGLGDRPADGSQGAIVYPPYDNWYFRIPEEEISSNAAYPPGFVQN